MDKINTIDSILGTLGNIEVKGRANIERLLACMQTLDKLKDEIIKEAAENAAKNK